MADKPDLVTQASAKEMPKLRTLLALNSDKLICGRREQDYAPPSVNFANTARAFEALTGIQMKPHQVGIFMLCMKLSRINTSPENIDHWVDVIGYGALAGEVCLQPNLVVKQMAGDTIELNRLTVDALTRLLDLANKTLAPPAPPAPPAATPPNKSVSKKPRLKTSPCGWGKTQTQTRQNTKTVHNSVKKAVKNATRPSRQKRS